MTVLKILGGVILFLLLLGAVRLGGRVEYSADGVRVWIRFGQFHFSVFPAKKKKSSEKKPAKEAPQKTVQQEKKSSGGSLETVKRFLPLICEAAGELKQKIRIDLFHLDFLVATGNAADTAIKYGYANMLLGMFLPLIEQNFQLKDPQIRTALDFASQTSKVYIKAEFSARLSQLVQFAVRFAAKFLKAYQNISPRAKGKKEVS